MITFERTASHGATNGETLPFIMSLRLLDSKDTPITSQLAPFGQSYDVSKSSATPLALHVFELVALGSSLASSLGISKIHPT